MSEESNREESPLDAIVVSTTYPPRRPPDVRDDVGNLLHWLYTNNPFYVISAALVFIGLWRSFQTGEASDTVALASGLAIYTVLLAVTAWFLIRFGSLWQDVRTLLVVVVLLLLGTSVSLDRSLIEEADWGVQLSVAGFVFAVGISELLLHGIRLRLPFWYRLPYHAALALFFLYPIVLSHWADEPDNKGLHWAMFGFSTLAAVVCLMLLPAVRRGAAYVAENGSPWTWPWYPWTLFGALGLGVCLRACYLCISFHAIDGDRTIFKPYFFLPLLLAMAILLLETWAVTRHAAAKFLALFLPICMMILAQTAAPGQADDFGFLMLFHSTLGVSPLFVALLAATAFYAFAWLRGAWEASRLLLLAVAGFAICGRDTFNPNTTCSPQGLPILLVGLGLLLSGLGNRCAIRFLLGAWCIVLMFWIDYREASFAAHHGAIPIHLMLFCAMIVGAIFRDEAGRVIQTLGAAALLGLTLIASLRLPHEMGDLPPAVVNAYPLLMAALACTYGLTVKNAWYYASALGSVCGWLAVPGWTLFQQARKTLAGMDYIVWGAASFLLAFLVSLMKMQFFQRLYRYMREKE
jgi:hypothetical protein